MNLVESIARADRRALAASALGCFDRCVPLLGADPAGDEVLRPLWTCLAEDGAGWDERLTAARDALRDGAAPGEAAEWTRRMLEAAPDTWESGVWREWADACSVAALRVHRMLDGAGDPAAGVAALREGRTEGMSPLVAAELERQSRVLHTLGDNGAGGLREALDVSTEGRRVVRAVVSRRARSRA
ncbi:hypothetical protein ACIREE_00540 [Streptomyces sp. NPDC102467]|uniref:hypothetical protein n=1 Tax=Streptomyces sp. NPDC102467 TaxID=3366179 RepID=UPI0038111474